MRKAMHGVLVVLLVAGVGACRGGKKTETHIHQQPPAQPNTVVIEKSHSHGTTCGHYHADGKWYADPGHTKLVVVE